MRILFICNQNQNRSKTAEEIFKGKFETKSAGLYNANPVTEKQLLWADAVIVMEDEQRAEISKRFPTVYIQKRIISLEIPDVYYYNQPELVRILKSKVEQLIEPILHLP
ncbi:phosphotyrosine protein phosphatase [Candidatus Woesearchaeota archaeon]|nr:phosphotyrosine protein phosphatase [Candidatus Woesearchaeota archaeon]MBI2661442.1 phosphotyrosine protein phosphatase [Candidatus Woesearchaeota archaeon]